MTRGALERAIAEAKKHEAATAAAATAGGGAGAMEVAAQPTAAAQADGEAMPEFLQTGEGMQADGEVRRIRARRPFLSPSRGPPGCADPGAAVHVREDEVHVPEEVRVHRADDDGIADAATC